MGQTQQEKAPEAPHTQFKVLITEPNADGSLPLGIHASVAELSRSVALKSIGVEYLEATNKVVLSIGYRADEKPEAMKLVQADLGVLAVESAPIEEAMTQVAKAAGPVVCHEFYVRTDNSFHLVMLVADK